MDTIRIARLDDAEGIAAVHVRAWQAAYRGLIPQAHLDGLDVAVRAAQWRSIIERSGDPIQRTWVEGVDETVRGFAIAGRTRDEDDDPARVGELQAIYIDPDQWRRGTGSALMGAVIDHLAAAGLGEATVWVLAGNTIGMSFYEKHGWHADGASQTEVWEGSAMDEIRLRRSLR